MGDRMSFSFRLPIFSYAFRLFFLCAALAAIFVIGYWALVLNGSVAFQPGKQPLHWHGHEMLIGFVMATVAGFLLTALATWTGRPAVSGAPLFWLGIAWLAGRIAMFWSQALPAYAVLALDMLFPALLCVFVAREVIAARNRRNYKIVAIVALLALLNLGYHLLDPRTALLLMVHGVLLLVAVIGGRVVPNFTANWLRGQGVQDLPSNHRIADALAIGLTLLVGVAASLAVERELTAVLAVAAALAHAFRVSQWRGLRTLGNPLLFVLHLAYGWLPAGYVLLAMASLQLAFTPSAALHALMMGAIGTMILAMMTRVPLGHTGRPLRASRTIVVAYAVLTVAVIARIAGPVVPGWYLATLNIAAIGWCAAFVLFVHVYLPVMLGPRLDSPA